MDRHAADIVRSLTSDAVRDLVKAECLRPSNRLGSAFFDQHVLPVVAYGRQLAQQLGANPEVVELAGYLHDLSAIRDLACIPTHHIESARISRDILRESGWPGSVVEAVCRCVASHSAPVTPGEGTLEEVCVSNADVMSQLARPAYWFFYLHRVRGLGLEEGLSWWQTRIDHSFRLLVEEARTAVAAEHAAALRFLEAARRRS